MPDIFPQKSLKNSLIRPSYKLPKVKKNVFFTCLWTQIAIISTSKNHVQRAKNGHFSVILEKISVILGPFPNRFRPIFDHFRAIFDPFKAIFEPEMS